MARFRVGEEDKFGGQGGGGFFKLAKDRETAKVRFLFNDTDDIEGYAVHQIELNGKKRYVNCLRDYGAPVDDCPFCKAGKFVTAKYFIPLYNITTGQTQTWERGKKFGSKLSSLCSRYPNIVSHTFEIERNGKPQDTSTSYEIYEIGRDDTTLEDFEEVKNPLGTIILDKSAEEMEVFLSRGAFPESNNSGNEEAPIRRRSAADEAPRRRTPATEDVPWEDDNGGRRREAF